MWRTVNIQEVCEQIYAGGDAPSKSEYTKKKTAEFSVPIFSNGVENAGLYGYTKKARTEKPAITISARGTIGHIELRDEPFLPIVRLIVLVPKEELIDINFLKYALISCEIFSSGSSIPQLTVPMLKTLDIYLPPLAEQQRIVAKLDAAFAEIDRAVEVASARLSEHQNITEAYLEKHFERELTGADVKRMDEGLEKITYGFTNPMPTSDSGKYLITAKNVIGGSIDYDNARFTTVEAFENELTEKSKPKIGDVLLTKDGTLGRLAVVDREGICVNQSVAVLRTNSHLNPHYLKWQLSSPLFQRRMKSEAGGTTIKHIYITRVDKMGICIPQVEHQLELVDKAEYLDKQVRKLIELRHRQLANLHALKPAILAQELQPPQSAAA